jgi:hypothetical protein
MLFLFGLILLIISVLYWNFVSTPYALGVIVSITVVAIISIAGGLKLYFKNQNRIVKYQQEYQADQHKFIVSEIERTEGFIWWYP